MEAQRREPMSQSKKIGGRIKVYREKLGMTREDLAERAVLPTSLIDEVENGSISPAIGVMVKLARALGQRVGTFTDDQLAKDPVIVKSTERELGVASHKESGQGHYRYHALGAGKADRHMEPFFIHIEQTDQRIKSSHEGEEFVAVISGEIELLYGNNTHLLKEGDTMYYNSLVPHCVSAVNGEAKIYAVIFTL
jgi:transcriptional regulator with XRE-family HTH domain